MLGTTHRNTCRICGGSDLLKFLDLGEMPLAGGFIKKEHVKQEEFYPLRVYFCRSCAEVQLLDVVSPNKLFRDYRFLASVTQTLSNHFACYAREITTRFLNKESLVVEFGSNDGVLLKPLQELGIRALGVEPAVNIAAVARSRGLDVINDYFTTTVADKIVSECGKADIVCGNNVFAHIDDVHEVLRAIDLLLKEEGVFVFEVHYLVDLLDAFQYDMIYHEHLFYHSLTALSYLASLHGLEIFDVKKIPIHSGSIRVYARRVGKGNEPIKGIVQSLLTQEQEKGIDQENTYRKFAIEVETRKAQIVEVVYEARAKNKRIIGYGASGRSSVHLNFCKFGPETVEYIVDASPERQGRVTPGTHIPIVGPDVLRQDCPDYAILFAWNYEDEIRKKEKGFVERGGRFIVPLPEVRIVP